ncbi:DUF4272 domain-containing protein [Chitinilyticum piscinae]|uniref:DUF4272 domain-containing protein n=1 Tax=Chitinilyticum piscinae TaxID=2866724 RepID=A0A8J7K9F1_9NEIS|nr:DUF4272 domain-containing protein [Chitinilyticum piscinae]MBE9608014.1 DUF4272 domain-containing protein [Chitinilyticum piscinae]
MSLLINVYSTLQCVPEPDFPHTLLGRRDHSDPELAGHLDGFVQYALSLREQMTFTLYHLMRHLQRVRVQLSLEVSDEALPAFSAWAARSNVVCYLPDGSVRDAALRVLLAAGGDDADARLPYPDSAWQRKRQSDAILAEEGVHVPAHLPPVLAEEELLLRPAGEVLRRAAALFAVAVRAESLAMGRPIPVDELAERLPLAAAALSPAEVDFWHDPAPQEQAVVNACWRYEALRVLVWALRLSPAPLSRPDAICDVSALAQCLFGLNWEEALAQAELRPAAEILDQLDRHFRYHWACRQARQQQREPDGGLLPGVVMERHHALNWLVQFLGAQWDEVDTPT